MNGLRAPVVAGLDPGAGTSTLAAALHGKDGGCGARADIVVCGGRGEPLRRAEALRPAAELVLAVAGPSLPRSELRALEARFAAVVLLPRVTRWHGIAAPLEEAAALLGKPADHLPRPLRGYAGALRLLAAAVLRSGGLQRPVPPLLVRPRTVQLWRGLQPVERRVLPRPVLLTPPVRLGPAAARPIGPLPETAVPPAPRPAGAEPDDEALEAEPFTVAPVATGRAG